MRKGKMVAQGAHSSLASLLSMGHTEKFLSGSEFKLRIEKGSALESWLLTGKFTKICVRVKSEEELNIIYKAAQDKNIPCALIRDAGLTEFGGVPTLTGLSVGPAWSDEVDEITGDKGPLKRLQLL